jgi:hypothetical protein
MTPDAATELALTPEYRLVDAVKVTGLTKIQILHAGRTKLKFPNWNTGKGNPRLFSLLELFQLRLMAAIDQRVPPRYLQHLADGAAFYLHKSLTSASYRKKPAVVVAYPDDAGHWWFLLVHDGKWPASALKPASEMLILIRIREILGRLVQGICEQLRSDLELHWAPDELRATLAADLSAFARSDMPIGPSA